MSDKNSFFVGFGSSDVVVFPSLVFMRIAANQKRLLLQIAIKLPPIRKKAHLSAAVLIRSKRALKDFLARPSRPHRAILVFGLMMKLSLGGTKVCERYSGIMGSPYLLQTDCNFKCLASIASEKSIFEF